MTFSTLAYGEQLFFEQYFVLNTQLRAVGVYALAPDVAFDWHVGKGCYLPGVDGIDICCRPGRSIHNIVATCNDDLNATAMTAGPAA